MTRLGPRGWDWSRAAVVALMLVLVAGIAPVPTAASAAPWRFSGATLEPSDPTVGDVATLRFNVVDDQGAPVPGLSISAELRAPATSYDQSPTDPVLTTVGRPAGDPGNYVIEVALNEPGRWWLDVQAIDSTGQTATTSEFLVVSPSSDVPQASIGSTVFLRADAWGAFYRLDPSTGSVITLSGQQLLQVGERSWMGAARLTATGPVSSLYGGTWHLTVDVNDSLTGASVVALDLGDIRASVQVGSADQPAIATSLAAAPDGSRLYVYWARQLGQGWMAHVLSVNPADGKVVQQRDLVGAITADVFWARLDVTPDGRELILAEQAIRSTSAPVGSGYRLTVLRADTLATVAEHRRVPATADPLTDCLLAFPGPAGPVGDQSDLRYSLCSPDGQPNSPKLVTWDPRSGGVVHQVSLDDIALGAPSYVDGVASPDGRRFYAVNTATWRVAEVDMVTGMILREANFAPPPPSPPPWDRFFNWFLGIVSSRAVAAPAISPGVSIAPNGQQLYLVAARGDGHDTGDGVLVIDTASLQVIGHLLTGQQVTAIMVAPTGQLIVREAGTPSNVQLAILDPNGQTRVSLALPDQANATGGRH